VFTLHDKLVMDIKTFEGFRVSKNVVLHETFRKKFLMNCRKFDSLSKNNSYRKIQRKTFIERTNDDDNITNILNKISETNIERLQTKIMMKLNVHNAHSFCKQILSYSQKSSVNSQYLAKLMIEICKELDEKYINRLFESSFDEYIQNFLVTFDIENVDHEVSEEYHDFLERNLDSIKMRNTSLFILHMLMNHTENILSFKYDIHRVFSILCDKLHTLINKTKIDDELIFKVLEVMYSFLIAKAVDTNCQPMDDFKNTFSSEEIQKKLKNKTRFKLMDIFDLI